MALKSDISVEPGLTEKELKLLAYMWLSADVPDIKIDYDKMAVLSGHTRSSVVTYVGRIKAKIKTLSSEGGSEAPVKPKKPKVTPKSRKRKADTDDELGNENTSPKKTKAGNGTKKSAPANKAEYSEDEEAIEDNEEELEA